MIIPWHPLAELVKALLIWPWLETFGTVAAASAWPLAILGIVLVLRRQAVALLAALVKRVDDIEEMSGPAGISAKFAFGRELGQAQNDLASVPARQTLPEPGGSIRPESAGETEPERAEGTPGEAGTADGPGTPDEAGTADGGTPEFSGPSTPQERERLAALDRRWEAIHRQSSADDWNNLTASARSGAMSAHSMLEDIDKRYGRLQIMHEMSFIERLAEISPRHAVVEGFLPVEKAAARFVAEFDGKYRGNPVIALRRMSSVPVALKSALQSLSQLRNQAAHEPDLMVTVQDALEYVGTAQQAALEIDELLQEFKPRPNDD